MVQSGKGIPIVFIHGFCEDMSIWDSVTSSLTQDCRAITIDLPGFGKSDNLEIPQSLADLAKQVHQKITAIGITQYAVVGHSLGGYVSLELAKQYSHNITGIALIHSTAFADDPEKQRTRLKTIDFVRKRGVNRFVRSFVPQLFADKTHPSIDTVLTQAVNTKLEVLEKYTLLMKDRSDNSSTFKNWKKVCFFIVGLEDGLVPIAMSRMHKKLMSADHYIELEKVAHMGMYESPDQIASLIRKFSTNIS